MDEAAIRGMQLFKGKARCLLCHNGHNVTDNQFHNLGVPQEGLLKEDVGRYNVTRRQILDLQSHRAVESARSMRGSRSPFPSYKFSLHLTTNLSFR